MLTVIRNGLGDLSVLFRDPSLFARQRTVRTRRMWNRAYKAAHFATYMRRRQLVKRIPAHACSFVIPEDKGYVLWKPMDFPLLQSAIAEADAVFKGADLPKLAAARPPEASFVAVPHHVAAASAIGQLATHPAFIRPFAEYIGGVPILRYVQIMYSPNDRMVENSAQYFHLDGQDVRSLQVFVYVEDVGEENGPVTVVPAELSERIARELGYRKTPRTKRIDDRIVAQFADPSRNVKAMTGSAGTLCVFDGDRCFHYGSRKATCPRRILQFEYVSAFAFTLPRSRSLEGTYADLVRTDAPEWQRLVVAP